MANQKEMSKTYISNQSCAMIIYLIHTKLVQNAVNQYLIDWITMCLEKTPQNTQSKRDFNVRLTFLLKAI